MDGVLELCRSMDPARDAVTGNGVQSGRQAECLGRRRGERRSKLRRAFRARAHTHFPAGQLLPRLDYLTALSFSAAPSLHHWVGDQSSPKFPIQRAMRHCHLFNGSLLHISIALKLLFDPISKESNAQHLETRPTDNLSRGPTAKTQL